MGKQQAQEQKEQSDIELNVPPVVHAFAQTKKPPYSAHRCAQGGGASVVSE